MMTCPICKTEYEPRDGSCPSCGPIPHIKSIRVLVPDYAIPGVRERVAAEADYMAHIHDPHGRRK